MTEHRVSVGSDEFTAFLGSLRDLSVALSGMADIIKNSLQLDPPQEVTGVLLRAVLAVNVAAKRLEAVQSSIRQEYRQ